MSEASNVCVSGPICLIQTLLGASFCGSILPSQWRDAISQACPALAALQTPHQLGGPLVGNDALVGGEVRQVVREAPVGLHRAEDGEKVVDVEAIGVGDETLGLDIREKEGCDVDSGNVDDVAEPFFAVSAGKSPREQRLPKFFKQQGGMWGCVACGKEGW